MAHSAASLFIALQQANKQALPARIVAHVVNTTPGTESDKRYCIILQDLQVSCCSDA